jgi:hypothetical protein
MKKFTRIVIAFHLPFVLYPIPNFGYAAAILTHLTPYLAFIWLIVTAIACGVRARSNFSSGNKGHGARSLCLAITCALALALMFLLVLHYYDLPYFLQDYFWQIRSPFSTFLM